MHACHLICIPASEYVCSLYACVRACVRVCVCAMSTVCVCMSVNVRLCTHMFVCVCVYVYISVFVFVVFVHMNSKRECLFTCMIVQNVNVCR